MNTNFKASTTRVDSIFSTIILAVVLVSAACGAVTPLLAGFTA